MRNQLLVGDGSGDGNGGGDGDGNGDGDGDGNGDGYGHIDISLVHSGYLTDIREFTSFQLLKALIHV